MTTIGVDLGGTKIQAIRLQDTGTRAAAPDGLDALADGGNYTGPVGGGYEVTGTHRLPTPPRGSATDIADAVALAAKEAGLDDVAALTIGFAGPVDHDRGTVVRAPNLPGFGQAVPFARLVEDRVGVPVSLENDVNVAVVGEHRLGAGAGVDDLLGVWLGTGVGGGLVLDGSLRRGPHGFAGEIGHMVVRFKGRRPPAGIRGSLESYAGRASMQATAARWARKGKGRSAIFPLMKAKGRTAATSGTFHKAYAKGDHVARKLIDEAEYATGVATASLVNALDLERVVVGGGVADRFGEPMIRRIAAVMSKHLIAPDNAPEVVGARLGDLAGGLGAALLAEDPG
ncbi:MAG: ROK family protein [Acidimicrobiia bacterium]|nr:ROK family protein [Acidimicrobiia bacterium]